jgi:predicted permease
MRPLHWVYTIPSRLRSLFGQRQADRELDDELRDHVERKTEEHIAKGLPSSEARRQALLEMGGIEKRKEECRDVRRVNWIQDLIQDLHFSLRTLRKSPGFTAIAILTLALGIGANIFAFSVIDAWLLRPLHFKQPGKLVLILKSTLDQPSDPAIFPGRRDYEAWKRESHSFDRLAGAFWRDFIRTGISPAQELPGMMVTEGFFETLGVPAQIGRTFDAGDLKGPPVLVLSHEVWQNQFGSSPDVVDESVILNGKVFRIVGVMPSDFDFRMLDQPNPTAVWVLLQPGERGYDLNSAGPIAAVGRLKPDVSAQNAQAELSSIQRQVDAQYPNNPKGYTVLVSGLQADNTRAVRASLFTLIATVALVLLMVCTNLSSLLLSRATGRQREMVIRAALGSGRAPLIRQLLTESGLLALLGSALGVFLAYAAVRTFVARNPLGVLPPNPISINLPVLLFAAALTVATTLLFGLAPALQASRIDLSGVLREQGVGAGLGSRSHLIRNVLIVSEIGLSLIILVGASLMIQTLVQLQSQPLGFHAKGVTALTLDLPEQIYSKGSRFAGLSEQVLESLKQIPGITEAGATTTPLLSFGLGADLTIEGEATSGKKPGHIVDMQVVTPGYFAALGTALLRGRFFLPADDRSGENVAIVNEAAAGLFKRDPIGMQVKLSEDAPGRIVVGIVGNTRSMFYNKVAWETRPRVFIPLEQVNAAKSFGPVGHELFVYVRGRNKVSSTEFRHAISSVDPSVPLSKIEPLEGEVDRQFNNPILRSTVLAGFGLVALVLAAVGIYGIVSQSVAQRTREIGIRMALGATRSQVLRLVVGQGAKLALSGMAIGVIVALGLTRLLSSMLFGVTATNPLTFIAVTMILVGVALLASYVPARRAMKVDPMVALRDE